MLLLSLLLLLIACSVVCFTGDDAADRMRANGLALVARTDSATVASIRHLYATNCGCGYGRNHGSIMREISDRVSVSRDDVATILCYAP